MSGTLALTIFKGVFGFDIDRKLISIISYFLSFFYWPVNCATTVYKLYIAFQTVRNSNIAFIGLHCDISFALTEGIFMFEGV